MIHCRLDISPPPQIETTPPDSSVREFAGVLNLGSVLQRSGRVSLYRDTRPVTTGSINAHVTPVREVARK